MRLQELFETTEEDRALISLSPIIYDKIKPYINSGSNDLVRIGKVGDIADTPLHALNTVSIELLGGIEFIERAKDPDEDVAMYKDKELLAFYESDTNTVVLNSEFLGRPAMKTTITHELRHALDEIKSDGFPASPRNKNPEKFNKYFTPKKKEHRNSKTEYTAQPAEINARFTEILHKLTDIIPKRYKTYEPDMIKRQLTHDFNELLITYKIADLFPEKTQSADYKRLVKRAYDFMQKEINYVETHPEVSKRATSRW